MDQELLEILVCPESKQPVSLAAQDLVDRVNRAIEDGRLSNRGGASVEETVEGGLVREDGRVLYPIRESIPIMLIDEAIPLDEL